MSTRVETLRPEQLAQRRLAGQLLDLAGDGSAAPAVLVLELDEVIWSPSFVSETCAILDELTPVLIGVAAEPLPREAAPVLERLTTTLAPGGPGRSWVAMGSVEELLRAVCAHPDAALVLHGLLRATRALPVPDALAAEAAAYSALLAGPEFGRWLAAAPTRRGGLREDVVRLERDGGTLQITLDDPLRRNAFGRRMRDGLVDALQLAHLDPTVTLVRLVGEGPSFSAGGDLSEFGSAADPLAAYRARLGRSAAGALHRVADRTEAVVHGACVGAGIELPAFAGRIVASPDAWFCLPELAMGLVPGAGGTVSIPRRIGASRTAWMVLTGARIDAETARSWGLVDVVG
ncbi:enoyl-CoA hydratase/isomerase family protein [Nocardioides dubius]|uniref:Enoyl-CoA hydratase/isomerase family protein n=1 Tax=Nocardioides dubius TaxID=317019 RepID=A0ABN1TWZ5_9ACTN